MADTSPSCSSSRAAYAAFTAFGVFWGTWGAALPGLRSQSGVSEGQLGTALLFVGVGALPAMLLTGRLLDRLGSRLAAVLLAALGAAGLSAATAAHNLPSLIVGMLVVGATSGAADVAINTLAGQVEHATARPLLSRAHGVFSLAVVVASLTGGLLVSAGDGGSGLVAPFLVAAIAVLVLAAVVWTATTSGPSHRGDSALARHDPAAARSPGRRRPGGAVAPLVVVGLVGALAYATENAHQSWGAIFLTDTFAAPAQVASFAPATFAAVAAAARLGLAPWSRTHPTLLLVTGGAVAALGSLLLAVATSVLGALVGLAVAAVGTATLFPTLLSCTLREVAPERRGRATSAVSTTAYLGFLLGPAYVGVLADEVDLRGAVLGIAALAVVFTVAAPPISRWGAVRVTADG